MRDFIKEIVKYNKVMSSDLYKRAIGILKGGVGGV